MADDKDMVNVKVRSDLLRKSDQLLSILLRNLSIIARQWFFCISTQLFVQILAQNLAIATSHVELYEFFWLFFNAAASACNLMIRVKAITKRIIDNEITFDL